MRTRRRPTLLVLACLAVSAPTPEAFAQALALPGGELERLREEAQTTLRERPPTAFEMAEMLSAAEGDVCAALMLALDYSTEHESWTTPRLIPHDPDRAVLMVQLAIELGTGPNRGLGAWAENMLADWHQTGRHVGHDEAEALRLHRSAAAAGLMRSQIALGDAYRLGEGVPQNHRQALRWYTKAANSGAANAMFMAALVSVRLGEDLQAHMWANLAATHEFLASERAMAVQLRNRLGRDLSSANLQEAQRRASIWRMRPSPTTDAFFPCMEAYSDRREEARSRQPNGRTWRDG